MKARVFITLKNGVLDPQGKAIHHALEGLGFSGVNDVRAGKLIELDLAEGTSHADNEDMSCKLLANTEIENFRVAPGLGMRITVPAMGPAPIALDFAFPVAKADFDDTEVFSFSLGFSR